MSREPSRTTTSATSGVFATVLGLYLIALFFESAVPGLRYVKYGLPFLTMLLVGVAPPLALDSTRALTGHYFGSFLRLTTVCLAATLLSTLADQGMTRRFVEEAYFIVSPIVVAVLIFPYLDPEKMPVYARRSFVAVVCCYLADRQGEVITVLRNPSSILDNMVTSEVGSESQNGAAFIFGLFLLYFLFVRDRRLALWSLLFVVLSFKRIVMAGVLVAVVVYYLQRIANYDLRRARNLIPLVLVVVNALIFVSVYALSQGMFDDAIADSTGLSANAVTQGRADVYYLVVKEMGLSWFGSGLGRITVILTDHQLPILNAHSDILKYGLEVGPLVSCLWIFWVYRLNLRSGPLLSLCAYLNFLFISDNVSVYFNTMFAFYVLAGFLVARTATTSHPAEQALRRGT